MSVRTRELRVIRLPDGRFQAQLVLDAGAINVGAPTHSRFAAHQDLLCADRVLHPRVHWRHDHTGSGHTDQGWDIANEAIEEHLWDQLKIDKESA